jgi:hypothetical protein
MLTTQCWIFVMNILYHVSLMMAFEIQPPIYDSRV